MIAAGIGCREGAAADEVARALNLALKAHGIEPQAVDAVATVDAKAQEAAIAALSRKLGKPLVTFGAAELAAASARVITRSALAEAVLGTPSVAEAAALLAAGRNARLLGPRAATDAATAALAIGDGP